MTAIPKETRKLLPESFKDARAKEVLIMLPKYTTKNLSNKQKNLEIEEMKMKMNESHDEREHKKSKETAKLSHEEEHKTMSTE